jgi:hypothetical protein
MVPLTGVQTSSTTPKMTCSSETPWVSFPLGERGFEEGERGAPPADPIGLHLAVALARLGHQDLAMTPDA